MTRLDHVSKGEFVFVVGQSGSGKSTCLRLRLLERINRTGTTLVMATHDERIVDQMRRRVVELEHGKVVRDQERGVYGTGYDQA
jgi:ABC-type ATPase involved in cell division